MNRSPYMPDHLAPLPLEGDASPRSRNSTAALAVGSVVLLYLSGIALIFLLWGVGGGMGGDIASTGRGGGTGDGTGYAGSGGGSGGAVGSGEEGAGSGPGGGAQGASGHVGGGTGEPGPAGFGQEGDGAGADEGPSPTPSAATAEKEPTDEPPTAGKEDPEAAEKPPAAQPERAQRAPQREYVSVHAETEEAQQPGSPFEVTPRPSPPADSGTEGGEPSEGVGGGGGGGGGGGAEFFGMRGEGRRFVFVVDHYVGFSADQTKTVCAELAKMGRTLRPGMQFYIIGFCSACNRTWSLETKRFVTVPPKHNPYAAWLSAVLSEEANIRGHPPREFFPQEDRIPAIEFALRMKPCAIFLVSMDPGGARYHFSSNAIQRWNPGGAVQINTVGFQMGRGNDSHMLRLRQIARENRGQFRMVK